MSREQWGHGYWRGVEDAQAGKIKSYLSDEVKFWVAHMCCSNYRKDYDRSLFPVREWMHYANFCGLSEKYARKVYTYIQKNNWFEFKPNQFSECYVSGGTEWDWKEDYFVIPYSDYTLEEWEGIIDEVRKKIKEAGYAS